MYEESYSISPTETLDGIGFENFGVCRELNSPLR